MTVRITTFGRGSAPTTAAGARACLTASENPSASAGRPWGPLRPRRTGLERVQGLLPRRERLEDKEGAAWLRFIEECRALQFIALGNRAVLEDVAPATRPPTMLRVPRRHKQEHVSTVRPMPAPLMTQCGSHSSRAARTSQPW